MSQFETLLGRLDSYDESMLLNQFIWGLQPELACSISLQYPKSIAQVVSLAETMELVVKASRRPANKAGSSSNVRKGPNQSNRGRKFWRGGTGRGRAQGGGRNMGNSGERGHGTGGQRGGRGGSSSFDPLACYWCGVCGHLARDYPSTGAQLLTSSVGNSRPTCGSSFKSGHTGPKRGCGYGRQV